MLRKQSELLQTLSLPYSGNKRTSHGQGEAEESLAQLLKVAAFFEEKIGTTIGNVKDAMKKVADEIEANGLQIDRELKDVVPP